MTPAGAVIENRARVIYTSATGEPATLESNVVSAIVQPPPSRSSVQILRATSAGASMTSTAGPTQCFSDGALAPLAPPALPDGSTLDPMQPIALATATSVHGGEAVFVAITDPDQNRDAAAIDVAQLRFTTPSGDVELLQLSETAPNSGLFVGYVQTRVGAAAPNNCVLEVERNSELSSAYVDPYDPQDAASAAALVDPYGLVFDSRTGEPVNGARVRLVDATGAPAVVFGDDGLSSYPAEVETGQPVTDSSGTVYSLPAGVFRFPLVAPGVYRLEVTPPAGHSFPSTLSASELAAAPGAPYRISEASFGAAFTMSAGPAVAVDVPLDAAVSELYLQKTTTTRVAAIGDFVQYAITIENTAASGALASVRTIDRLPHGVRYVKGSTRIAGERAPDPEASADGRTLTFVTGALAPGQRAEIRYVVEIAAGARGPRLVNAAQAFGPDGRASNAASATIALREELFRDRAIIVGRVVEGDCSAASDAGRGVRGVRVHLEDGRYSITDEEGKYHFEDVAPGVHVAQLDLATIPPSLEPAPCAASARHAGRAYSQFLDVRGGALWRADFALTKKTPPKGTFDISLSTRLAPATDADRADSASAQSLKHVVDVKVERVPVTNLRVLVMLDEGLKYRPGSASLSGAPLADPDENSGVLVFALPEARPGFAAELSFITEVGAASSGALTIRAAALFDTPAQKWQRTQHIENIVLRGQMQYESASYRLASRLEAPTSEIRPGDGERLHKIVDEWRGATNLQLTALYRSDDSSSRVRAESTARHLSERLGIDAGNVALRAHDADEHIERGVALNAAAARDIEIAIDGLRVTATGGLTIRNGAAATSAATLGALDEASDLHPSTQERRRPASQERVSRARPFGSSNVDVQGAPVNLDIETLPPGVDWVLPRADAIPAIPAIKVAVQHRPEQRVELLVNGEDVSALSFEGAKTNRAQTVALSRWRGVDLRDGANELTAIVRDADGAQVHRLTRTIHYAAGAVRAELAREASTLIADGRTRPVIALRMFDASGQPARPGTLGAFRVDPPYRAWWEVASMNENKLLTAGEREPRFTVDADGLARLELEPTTQAGVATIELRFNERHAQKIRVWLEPEARDWILVGVAEGSAAHRTISDNVESAAEAGFDRGYTEDGRVAFFAKGAIKGDYLLTLAYDSARKHELEKERLFGVVEPDRFYTLYGDATEQRFEAASTRKLFMKLERGQFAALFGDFETGLTASELSRYDRTFTGFRSGYSGEHLSFAAFAAESEQGYVRDELQGDGASGLYRLSRRPLIVNSERVRIEIRDRFHTERVLESRELTRFLDYTIDYLNGTVFFRQPMSSRDRDFNHVFIVVEYEVLNGGEAQLTAGGRAAVNFAGDRVEVGATLIREGAAEQDATLGGVDMRWRIGAATELRAEVARTESGEAPGEKPGAYLAELTHVTERVDARAYVREQETDFGLGQQSLLEAGARKYGVDARVRLTEHLALEGETWREEVLTTGATREVVSAELRREADAHAFGVGVRHAADSGLPSGEVESRHAFVSGSVDLFDDRVTLRGSQDIPFSGRSESVDFPARTLVGLDYRVHADTTLFAEYERAEGAEFESDMTRIGVRMTPWSRAQLQSSMNHQATEYGPRVFANVGLTQSWQATERWAFDFGVDQSKTVNGSGLAPFNARAPLASGTLPGGDFTASFVGALYRSDFWTFTSRLEHRTSDEEDRLVVAGGFYREPVSGRAFSLATQWFSSRFADGSKTKAGEAQLGWVYRPVSSDWIVMNRLDLKHELRSDAAGEFESARAVNNLNANWRLDGRTQLGFQLGARYVVSTFDSERYDGVSALYGIDLRRDLNERFDVGLQAAMLTSLRSNVGDATAGVDFGFAAAPNVWISIGYNFVGFLDDDFDASRYTAHGPFIRFRMKADQELLHRLWRAPRNH